MATAGERTGRMVVHVDVTVRVQVVYKPSGPNPPVAWQRNPHTIKQEVLRRLDVARRQWRENGLDMVFVPERVQTFPEVVDGDESSQSQITDVPVGENPDSLL